MARKFRGSENVKIDAKGRMSIPAKMRRIFESCDPDWEPGKRPQMIIVHGPEDQKYLELFTMEAAEEIDRQIERMRRGSPERRLLEELMNGQSLEAEIDDDGRLLLPQKLRDQLQLTDMAFLIAGGDYLNLWKREDYETAGRDLKELRDSFPPGFDLRSLLPPLPDGV